MNITRLIEELQKIKEQHGDLEVWRDTDGAISIEVSTVTLKTGLTIENNDEVKWVELD